MKRNEDSVTYHETLGTDATKGLFSDNLVALKLPQTWMSVYDIGALELALGINIALHQPKQQVLRFRGKASHTWQEMDCGRRWDTSPLLSYLDLHQLRRRQPLCAFALAVAIDGVHDIISPGRVSSATVGRGRACLLRLQTASAALLLNQAPAPAEDSGVDQCAARTMEVRDREIGYVPGDDRLIDQRTP
jgi:hypothetical protein